LQNQGLILYHNCQIVWLKHTRKDRFVTRMIRKVQITLK